MFCVPKREGFPGEGGKDFVLLLCSCYFLFQLFAFSFLFYITRETRRRGGEGGRWVKGRTFGVVFWNRGFNWCERF